MISHKKKNRVSYREGEDEIIPRTLSNEHKIFENKRVRQIKHADSGSNRGSFSFFNVSSMEQRFKGNQLMALNKSIQI